MKTIPRSCDRLAAIVLFTGILGAAARAAQEKTDAGALAFPDLEVELTLPKLTDVAPANCALSTCKGEWVGKLGSSDVRVQLFAIDREEYDLFEPEDVVETWRNSIRDPEPDAEGKHNDFSFEPTRASAGAGGCTPIIATAQATKKLKSDPSQAYAVVLVGSLLPKHGWTLRADLNPPPSEEALRTFVAELEKSVVYKGKPCDPKWTDEEAKKYWQLIAPESTWKKYEKPVRTDHFIVLTNSTSPGPFVKKLEGWYTTIAKTLALDELPGRKLMPIILFRTDDDFMSFYRGHYKLEPKDVVDETSVTIGRWVATSCDYDNEYERLVDLCKQAMIVRARAWNGNRWFRSGMREYVATKPRERSAAYKAVKKGRFTPIGKLFDDSAWGDQDRQVDKTGTSDELSYWDQSCVWIEFLRDGPLKKDAFPRFVRTVGSIPATDRDAIVAAIESIYGMKLDALEKKWVEYCSKK